MYLGSLDEPYVFVPMVYYCPLWIHFWSWNVFGYFGCDMKLYLSMGCIWVFVASSFNHLMANHIPVTQIYPNSITPTWLSVCDESNLFVWWRLNMCYFNPYSVFVITHDVIVKIQIKSELKLLYVTTSQHDWLSKYCSNMKSRYLNKTFNNNNARVP